MVGDSVIGFEMTRELAKMAMVNTTQNANPLVFIFSSTYLITPDENVINVICFPTCLKIAGDFENTVIQGHDPHYMICLVCLRVMSLGIHTLYTFSNAMINVLIKNTLIFSVKNCVNFLIKNI